MQNDVMERNSITDSEKKQAKRTLISGGVFCGVFLLSFGALFMVGAIPAWNSPSAPEVVAEANAAERIAETGDARPARIIIDEIAVDARITHPESREISVLDEALTKGVVHYPGSGTLADESNMFLFGHSSDLPVVRNNNFKVFNRLEELRLGDVIKVYSDEREYRYEVTNLSVADAEDVLVSFKTGEKKLTLSTCNTFGAKSERFVVEATFVGSSPLAS